MAILRIQNAKAFELPDLALFMIDAFGACKIEKAQECLEAISRGCSAPQIGVWVVRENGEWTGTACVALPDNPFTASPYVPFFHVKNSAARKVLLKEGAAFIKAAGYNRVWVLNRSGHNDKAYKRLFRRTGWEPEEIGTVMEWSV